MFVQRSWETGTILSLLTRKNDVKSELPWESVFKTNNRNCYPVVDVVSSLNGIQLFCDATDSSPPGSSVHGISQARILEWLCHFLLQGISLSQGLNQSLLLGRWILYYSATREAKSDTLINRKKIGRDSKILYMVSSCICWRKEVYSCSCSVSDLERFLSRPTVIVLELAQFIVFSVFFI